MKLNQTTLKAKMHELAKAGDRESYDKLWSAINTLWNLGLVDYKLNNAMVREDHVIFESGEAVPMCDGTYEEIDFEALFEDA